MERELLRASCKHLSLGIIMLDVDDALYRAKREGRGRVVAASWKHYCRDIAGDNLKIQSIIKCLSENSKRPVLCCCEPPTLLFGGEAISCSTGKAPSSQRHG